MVAEIIALYTSSHRQDELRAASKATKLITNDKMGTEWAAPFQSKWGSAALKLRSKKSAVERACRLRFILT